jgi:hypothetical protein
MSRRVSTPLPFAFALLAAGCATTGSTFGSGVGDTLVDHPPYYAGARTTPVGVEGAQVGVFPVHFQPGDADASMFAPPWAAGSQLAALLGEMNGWLDSLTTSAGTRPVRLVDDGRVSALAPTSLGVPPDVRLGCETELDLPGEECHVPDPDLVALGRGPQYLKLSVGRPSRDWVAWAGGTMQDRGVSHALVLTLELSQFLPRQRGLRGEKYVELGTGHEEELPWLTSLETPLYVMQLTGALVDAEGRAVRIGVEGIKAKRTRFRVSALGAQELWSDEDVAELRSARREDLPGRPLAWQEAMSQLVAQLTR